MCVFAFPEIRHPAAFMRFVTQWTAFAMVLGVLLCITSSYGPAYPISCSAEVARLSHLTEINELLKESTTIPTGGPLVSGLRVACTNCVQLMYFAPTISKNT